MKRTMNLASFFVDVSSCQTLSSAGVYNLTQNITSTTNCITISTSNVILDCGPYRITYATGGGTTARRGVLINAGLDNITVKNCHIVNNLVTPTNSVGIYAEGSAASPITNLVITGIYGTQYSMYTGLIRLDSAHGANISNSNITAIGGSGVYPYAVRSESSDNLTFDNMRITTIGTDPRGITLTASNRSTIRNSVFFENSNGTGNQNQPVNIVRSTHTVVEDSTFEGTNGMAAFLLNEANHTIARRIYSNGTGATIFTYYNALSFNNTFYDSVFEATGSGDESSILISQTSSGSLKIVNTSYVTYTRYGSSTTTSFHHGWWVDITVKDVYGNIIPSATVNWSHNSGSENPNPSGSVTADSNGKTRLEIYSNSTYQTSTVQNHNNYTFNASSGSLSTSLSRNVVDNTELTLVLGTPVTSCSTLSSAGAYVLTQNITSANNCLTISASNVALSCNGHRINYMTDGTTAGFAQENGILINAGLNNITINDCVIVGPATSTNSGMGISYNDPTYAQNVTNLTITNTRINTTADGNRAVYIRTGADITIVNLTTNTSGSLSHAIDLDTVTRATINDSNIYSNGKCGRSSVLWKINYPKQSV
jgi:hypothetical protein